MNKKSRNRRRPRHPAPILKGQQTQPHQNISPLPQQKNKNNGQVLAATVGGAAIGNLLIPGLGGAILGGAIGAWLGNASRNKEKL